MMPSRRRRETLAGVVLHLVLMTSVLLVAPLPQTIHRAYAASDTETWTVFQANGDVRLRSSADTAIWRPLRRGETLRGAYAIATGPGGQVTLTHGDDVIHVAPDSRVEVRPRQPGSRFTQVMQPHGTLFYGVEARPGHRFRVVTPLQVTLASGTTFSIRVTEASADVGVAAGSVTVVANEGHRRREVVAGHVARVAVTQRATVDVRRVPADAYAQSDQWQPAGGPWTAPMMMDGNLGEDRGAVSPSAGPAGAPRMGPLMPPLGRLFRARE